MAKNRAEIEKRLEANKDKKIRTSFTLRLNTELLKGLRSYCSDKEFTMTEVIEECLKDFLPAKYKNKIE